MRKGIRRIVILTFVVIMMVGMIGGTFFNLMSHAKVNEEAQKEQEEILKKQEEQEEKEAKKEEEVFLSYTDFQYSEFFTYLAYKGLPIQNLLESNMEAPDGEYIAQAHWDDARFIEDEENIINPGGWIEIFEEKPKAAARVEELREKGFEHVYQKRSIVIYLDYAITGDAVTEYETAIEEYEKTTLNQILS